MILQMPDFWRIGQSVFGRFQFMIRFMRHYFFKGSVVVIL
jgi:hypothetical protein